MPTNDYEARIWALEKNIREGKISDENKELLWEFKRDLEVQNYSQGRIYKLLVYLKIIAENVDYNFEEASEDDLKDTVAWLNRRNVSEATKCDTRTILKRFYKRLNDGEYPGKVKWIKTSRKRSNNSLPKEMLTEEDIQELIKAAEKGVWEEIEKELDTGSSENLPPPALPVEVSEVSSRAERVQVVGKIVELDEEKALLDDGTRTIQVLIEEPSMVENLDTESTVRVFRSPLSSKGSVELQAEIFQPLDKLDLELYRKVREKTMKLQNILKTGNDS